MKKVLLISIIALGALMVSCGYKAAQANEEKEEISAQASPEISAIRVAMNLAKYGYEAESASALIEAANILIANPTQELEAELEQEKSDAEEMEKADKVQITPAQLLTDARKFAADDAHLLALAEDVKAKLNAIPEETRGAVGGPKRAANHVYAHGTDYYTIKFWAHELAEILVSGDGDTDLDIYVYDENGNFITSDADYTDDCYVRFYPAWTGPFRLKIVNRGGVYNNYVILTN